ncbi:hypothetical protein E2P81_ATG09335 [Venturia nashicola]|uniref:Uncharacterized protein n=1 Tax=Venturia nashicola TaxID=86259 RepID=A0A4Z1P4L8_9PEZI|nr:hypothetical protein E6O75_ATG09542 [Venturia nashicola]TLD25678.1 hypothetical protein E2P81_ATG09335 [Venturia nashicola]
MLGRDEERKSIGLALSWFTSLVVEKFADSFALTAVTLLDVFHEASKFHVSNYPVKMRKGLCSMSGQRHWCCDFPRIIQVHFACRNASASTSTSTGTGTRTPFDSLAGLPSLSKDCPITLSFKGIHTSQRSHLEPLASFDEEREEMDLGAANSTSPLTNKPVPAPAFGA